MTNNITVEVVRFKLKEGADEAAFLAASAGVEPFLQEAGGFIDRELLKGDDEFWIDVVHWQSKTQALDAAEQIMSSPLGQQFGQFIDEASIDMGHLHVKQTMQAREAVKA